MAGTKTFPRTTTPQPRRLLLVLAGAGLLVGSAMAGQPTCYNSWGGEEPNQQPCFAAGADTSATTWCCGKTDYCLSNGLCLRPGASNLMTQQGCTDKNWGGACKKFCSATSRGFSLNHPSRVSRNTTN